MSAVVTINGRRWSSYAWNRAFAKALVNRVGGDYSLCEQDWTDARYLWSNRHSPEEAAAKIGERRKNQPVATVLVRVWRDQYQNGVYTPGFQGDVEVRGAPDQRTGQMVAELFEKGERQGQFKVWLREPRSLDVSPVLVKWEAL